MADTNKILGAVINDRYRVVELIGKGGSGYVYKAVNVETNEATALKILRDISADDDESVIRFEKEVAVSAKLTSPHTVRVHEFGRTTEGYLLIAMEFLDGVPLTEVIRSDSPLSPRRAVSIVRQTLEALAEAHRMGIVHRDLKPDNIFLLKGEGDEDEDFVKVLDFGIAKFLLDDSVGDTLTRDGFVFGTPLYISPEQALGWQVSPASDIYSLGAVFFEMLTGDPPFNAETPIGLGMKHIYEPAPLDRIKVSGTAGMGIKRLLSLMLEKRPERRPGNASSALALFDNLEELTDTPFDVGRVTTIPHGGEANGSPTVRARPAREEDVDDYFGREASLAQEVVDVVHALEEEATADAEGMVPAGETKDYTEDADAALAEVPPSPEDAPSEEEGGEMKSDGTGDFDAEVTGELTGELDASDEKVSRKKKKKRKKKRKNQEPEVAVEATPLARPVAASAAPQPPVQPAAEPVPATEAPLVDPEGPASATAAPAERRRREEDPGPREAPQPPPRPAPKPKSKPAPKPAPEPPRAATAEDIALFSQMPGFGVAPPAEEVMDEDWRDPVPPPSGEGGSVGIFAWLVLLLGIAMAAFVVYALTKGGSAAPAPSPVAPIEAPAGPVQAPADPLSS